MAEIRIEPISPVLPRVSVEAVFDGRVVGVVASSPGRPAIIVQPQISIGVTNPSGGVSIQNAPDFQQFIAALDQGISND